MTKKVAPIAAPATRIVRFHDPASDQVKKLDPDEVAKELGAEPVHRKSESKPQK